MAPPYFVDNERQFHKRHHTMSLDTIHPPDVPRGKILYVKDECLSLTTQDIDRCRPTYKHLNHLDKPDLSVGNTDPEHQGSRARSYYPPMDRRPRDLSLTTADIEYAQPKNVKFKGNRHTDPVCPNYEMPSCHLRPITPPRWNGRHTNDVSDVELCYPKKLAPDRNYVRDPNHAHDIEFATPNYQERVKMPVNPNRTDRSMNVRDITDLKKVQTRCTNPLDPVYKVPTTETTSLHTKFAEEKGFARDNQVTDTHVGEVHGSKPRKLQWDNGEPQMSLLREDIAGTVPQRWIGAVPFNIYDPPEVKPVISFHDPHDIPGAQVSSLKKGIEGHKRGSNHWSTTTNPLNPHYQMLDGVQRPQPVQTMHAERGGGVTLHPMLQNRAASQSMPGLHPGPSQPGPGTGRSSLGTPAMSNRSQGSLRRDMSAPQLPQGSPAGSQRGGMRQYSPAGSQRGMPMPQYSPAGSQHDMPQYSQPQVQFSGSVRPSRTPSAGGTPSGFQHGMTVRPQEY